MKPQKRAAKDVALPVETPVSTPPPSAIRVIVPPFFPSPSAHAEALFGMLDQAVAHEPSPERLILLLRLAVAELRAVQGATTGDEPLQARIIEALRTVIRVREERTLRYVHGLSREHQEDWIEMALNLRRKIAALDAR